MDSNKGRPFVPALSFEFLTPLFDRFVDLMGYGRSLKVRLVDLLALQPGERVLDVGCGTGELLILAKQRHPETELVGLDVDERILRLARAKAAAKDMSIAFHSADAAAMPFEEDSFDVIVSSLVFHHLPTTVKRQTFAEIHRVLRPDGRFLLVDFGTKRGSWMTILDLATRLTRAPEAATIKDNFSGAIPGFLNEAGFDIETIAPRYRGLDFLLMRSSSRSTTLPDTSPTTTLPSPKDAGTDSLS
jgi:ubiquinone/menaquinone biosynthesis C-methylase UbiE